MNCSPISSYLDSVIGLVVYCVGLPLKTILLFFLVMSTLIYLVLEVMLALIVLIVFLVTVFHFLLRLTVC